MIKTATLTLLLIKRGEIILNVLILDNSAEVFQLIKEVFLEMENEYNFSFNIDTISDSNNILSIINEYDILILDIELDNVNGIDIALKIREFNTDIKIIFISNYSKYLIDGYKVHPDRYFMKPIDKIHFKMEMINVLKEYKYNYMSFYDKRVYVNKIYYKDILYVEYIQRKSFIHLLTGKIISTNLNLKDWLSRLKPYNFSQVHRSFIVNIRNISDYTSDTILLVNNEKIPLSRKYKDNFENDFIALLHIKL